MLYLNVENPPDISPYNLISYELIIDKFSRFEFGMKNNWV